MPPSAKTLTLHRPAAAPGWITRPPAAQLAARTDTELLAYIAVHVAAVDGRHPLLDVRVPNLHTGGEHRLRVDVSFDQRLSYRRDKYRDDGSMSAEPDIIINLSDIDRWTVAYPPLAGLDRLRLAELALAAAGGAGPPAP